MRLLVVSILPFVAIGLAPAADTPFNKPPQWKPLFTGVELTNLAADSPRVMKGHAVRIDLKADGIAFLATPGNGDRPGETDGAKTSTFLKQHKLQLAINAAPIRPDLGQSPGRLREAAGEVIRASSFLNGVATPIADEADRVPRPIHDHGEQVQDVAAEETQFKWPRRGERTIAAMENGR